MYEGHIVAERYACGKDNLYKSALCKLLGSLVRHTVINGGKLALLELVHLHHLIDEFKRVLKSSAASYLHHHRHLSKLRLVGAIDEVILVNIEFLGIKVKVNNERLTLDIKLNELNSTLVECFVVPAAASLDSLVGKNVILDLGVEALNVLAGLNESGHERASESDVNGLTTDNSGCFLTVLTHNEHCSLRFLCNGLFNRGLLCRLFCNGLLNCELYCRLFCNGLLNCGLFNRGLLCNGLLYCGLFCGFFKRGILFGSIFLRLLLFNGKNGLGLGSVILLVSEIEEDCKRDSCYEKNCKKDPEPKEIGRLLFLVSAYDSVLGEVCGIEYHVIAFTAGLHNLYAAVILNVNNHKLVCAEIAVLSGDKKSHGEVIAVNGNMRAVLGEVNIVGCENLESLVVKRVSGFNVGSIAAGDNDVCCKTVLCLNLNDNVVAILDLVIILLIGLGYAAALAIIYDNESCAELIGVGVVRCVLILNGDGCNNGVSSCSCLSITGINDIEHCKNVSVTGYGKAVRLTVIVNGCACKYKARAIDGRFCNRPRAIYDRTGNGIVAVNRGCNCGSGIAAGIGEGVIGVSNGYAAWNVTKRYAVRAAVIYECAGVIPSKSGNVNRKRSDAPRKSERLTVSNNESVVCAIGASEGNRCGISCSVLLNVIGYGSYDKIAKSLVVKSPVNVNGLVRAVVNEGICYVIPGDIGYGDSSLLDAPVKRSGGCGKNVVCIGALESGGNCVITNIRCLGCTGICNADGHTVRIYGYGILASTVYEGRSCIKVPSKSAHVKSSGSNFPSIAYGGCGKKVVVVGRSKFCGCGKFACILGGVRGISNNLNVGRKIVDLYREGLTVLVNESVIRRPGELAYVKYSGSDGPSAICDLAEHDVVALVIISNLEGNGCYVLACICKFIVLIFGNKSYGIRLEIYSVSLSVKDKGVIR